MAIQDTIKMIVWICLIILAYSYFIYPLILFILSKIHKNPVVAEPGFTPEVSVVMSAYNEENLIEDAVRSIFNSDYPEGKLKVYIGSDGSTDRTIDILKELKKTYGNLYYFEFPRSGKNQILNKLVPETKTDIIIYMDADCRCQPNTIANVIGKFANKKIGAVICSMQSVETRDESRADNDNTGRHGETMYQKYEHFLRINESKVASTVNSLGALYAIRRENYKPLPNNNVCDDYMPLLYTALRRMRVIYDPDSTVYEVRQKTLSDEFMRRVRLAAGGMATVWAAKRLLLPFYGWTSFFLWSHKVLRWLSPLFLISVAAGTVYMAAYSQLFMSMVILQVILYLSAFFGWLFERTTYKMIPFRIPLFFVSMNIGFLFGLIRFISGRQNARWERNGK